MKFGNIASFGGLFVFGLLVVSGFIWSMLWLEKYGYETNLARERERAAYSVVSWKPDVCSSMEKLIESQNALSKTVAEMEKQQDKADLMLGKTDEIDANLKAAAVARDRFDKILDELIDELKKKPLAAPKSGAGLSERQAQIEEALRLIGNRRVEPAFWGVITNQENGVVLHFMNGFFVEKEGYEAEPEWHKNAVKAWNRGER